MKETSWIWFSIILVLVAIFLFVGISQVFGQTTNSTPIITVPTQQGTVQATDPIGLASIIVTSIGIPTVAYFLKKKDDNTKEEAKVMHNQNEFRLEAGTEAVKEMNNSLKATDAANLEFAKIVQVLFKPFKENTKLKEAYAKYTVNGTPVLQKLDEYIEESQIDITEYYNGNNEKLDKFDTCNDPIVQRLTAVRNKSKK